MDWGEVNPTHAYYNGSCTSKDTEDSSWSTSFKTRRTQKTSSALEDFICVVFVLDRNIVEVCLHHVEVGLHQGSTISPYLFTLILDELSREIQESIPWCMIFAGDIVLIAESAEGLNNRIEKWREALEENGLRVSREKTEYLRCDFGRYEVLHQEVNIRIGDRILQPNEYFRYLGSVIHRSGRIDEDVAHRIGVGWMKWRAASGVMCDRRILLKLKGNFYRVAIRPAMLCGSECWPVTKAQANRVEVAELRMLRWTCDEGRKVEMVWACQEETRNCPPVRRVEAMLVEGLGKRGRPKLRWEDRLKQDMKELLLSEDMTSDRNSWRDRIRISGLDELLRGIQESIPWCMIFADDIVLIAESAEGLNNRIEKWREALEDNGLRVSREKTEYLRCDFGRYEVLHQEVNIRIRDQILQPNESFRYLGSVIHRSGRIDEDVAHRTGVECWRITKAQTNRVEVAELRMLRLRWFRHVKRRPETAPVRRVEAMLVEGSRRRGRPKLRWEDRLKQDMKELLLSEDITSDRNA
ncbi:ataxia telangiectasia mutated family protein [Tanacetum coccineum]